MASRSLAAVALLATQALAAALPDPFINTDYTVKETHSIPRGWSRVSKPSKDHLLELQIGLKQERFDELRKHLFEISDPKHARYGQHLSADEVNELVKPSNDALSQVQDWLESHNILGSSLGFSQAKDWISVKLPVEEAEKLLDTDYAVYRHEDGTHLVRTPQWSLPQHLHDHVTAVQPTTSFLRASPDRRTFRPVVQADGQVPDAVSAPPHRLQEDGGSAPPSVSDVCNADAVTPDCLRTLYETYSYTPQAPNGTVKVGLTNYIGEYNNRTDVAAFLQQYRPEAAGAAQTFTETVIAGAQPKAGNGQEGNLDAETILGIAWPLPLTAYSTGGSPPFNPDQHTPSNTNEPYLTWTQYLMNQSDADIPQTISTSYGDDEQSVPLDYANQVCNMFAQLGARGKTLIFSSGDSGVGSNGSCVSNDGKNTSMFIPNFPASCPYVTTVGATQQFNPEIAAEDPNNGFTSGGGFSNYFPAPDYQSTTVNNYIYGLDTQYAGLYNRSGRGYPDISAQGEHFVTIYDGQPLLLDGTSASAPTAASVIALVNDALVAAGKPPLGFLNPWLYSTGYTAFTDVTVGSSAGCDTAGFPATTGWDAVTGFGTPRFSKLLSTLGLNGTNSTSAPQRRSSLYHTPPLRS